MGQIVDICFEQGKNHKTQQPQLKMMTREGDCFVQYVPDRRSAIQPTAGVWYRGTTTANLVPGNRFRVTAVDVFERNLEKSPMSVAAKPAPAPAPVAVPEQPSKKGQKFRVSFERFGGRLAGNIFHDGVTIEVTPSVHGQQPKEGERWEVRVSRLRLVAGQRMSYTSECELVRRLPDLAPASTGFERKLNAPLAVTNESPVTDSDGDEVFDIELIRGVHPVDRSDQWQCLIKDEVAGTSTLNVVDRHSLIQPTMNGQRFQARVTRQIFPKPEDPNYETSTFRIVLVELLRRIETVADSTVTPDILKPKPMTASGLIGRIGHKKPKMTRSIRRASRGERLKKAEGKPKKDKKKGRSRAAA